jgi:hypothetical protein
MLLLFGAVRMGALSGCSDPTESTARIVLKNDLGVRVSLRICADARCRDLAPTNYQAVLEPGGTVTVNVSSEGVPTTYRVTVSGSPRARCLALRSHERPPTPPVVLLSRSDECENK